MKTRKTLEEKLSGWSKFKSGVYKYAAIPTLSILSLLQASCGNNDSVKNDSKVSRFQVGGGIIESQVGDPWGGKGDLIVYSYNGEIHKSHDDGSEEVRIVEKEERDLKENASYVFPRIARINGEECVIFMRKSYDKSPAMPSSQWFRVPLNGGKKELLASLEEGLSDVYYTEDGDRVALRLGKIPPAEFRNLPVEFSEGYHQRISPDGTRLTTEQYSNSGREIYIQNLKEKTDENRDGVLNASKPELLIKGYHGFWWINNNQGVAIYRDDGSGGIALIDVDKRAEIGRCYLGARPGYIQVDEDGDCHYSIRIDGKDYLETRKLKELFENKLDYEKKDEK